MSRPCSPRFAPAQQADRHRLLERLSPELAPQPRTDEGSTTPSHTLVGCRSTCCPSTPLGERASLLIVFNAPAPAFVSLPCTPGANRDRKSAEATVSSRRGSARTGTSVQLFVARTWPDGSTTATKLRQSGEVRDPRAVVSVAALPHEQKARQSGLSRQGMSMTCVFATHSLPARSPDTTAGTADTSALEDAATSSPETSGGDGAGNRRRRRGRKVASETRPKVGEHATVQVGVGESICVVASRSTPDRDDSAPERAVTPRPVPCRPTARTPGTELPKSARNEAWPVPH